MTLERENLGESQASILSSEKMCLIPLLKSLKADHEIKAGFERPQLDETNSYIAKSPSWNIAILKCRITTLKVTN